MNTKLQLFCAIILCLIIKWNAVFAAGHDIDMQKTATKEIKSDPANVAYDAMTTRSTENGNVIQSSDLILPNMLLNYKGVGYPKANAQSRIDLRKICDAPTNYTKEELEKARQAYWLTGFSVNGVTDEWDEYVNGLELQKARTGAKAQTKYVLNFFGKFFIKSKRGTHANSYAEVLGYWLLNTKNNTFDGAGDPYYSEELSSVMLIEPVTKTTGIQQIETTAKRTSENKIYTLSGQRVFAEKLSDLSRGIYIVNGKKLLVQ